MGRETNEEIIWSHSSSIIPFQTFPSIDLGVEEQLVVWIADPFDECSSILLILVAFPQSREIDAFLLVVVVVLGMQ